MNVFLSFVHDHLLACFGLLNHLVVKRDDDFVRITLLFLGLHGSDSATSSKVLLWQDAGLDQEGITIPLAEVKELVHVQSIEIESVIPHLQEIINTCVT